MASRSLFPFGPGEDKLTELYEVHPLKSRVADFIASLKALEREPISTPRVSELIVETQPSPEALAPYLLWSPERYTRNLIYRDPWFEVIALCWLPSQKTPIHSHNGQLGWLTVVQGELVCRNYRFVRSEEAKKMPHGRYEEPVGRPVEVELQSSATCEADGRVAVVDRRQTTHQIENLEKSRHGSVSLHVYSKPIDSCVLFDETSRCCARRRLQYYSTNGVIVRTGSQKDEQLAKTAA